MDRLHCIYRVVIFTQFAVTEQRVVNHLMDKDWTVIMGCSGWSSLAVGIRPALDQSPNRICASALWSPCLWEQCTEVVIRREDFFANTPKLENHCYLCLSNSFLQQDSPTQSLLVWTDPSQPFIHRVSGRSYSSCASPSWHSALSCHRCLCHPCLSSFPEIPCEYKWHWSDTIFV